MIRTSLSKEEAMDRRSVAIIFAALLRAESKQRETYNHEPMMNKAIELFNKTTR